jgi:hypothetical protein
LEYNKKRSTKEKRPTRSKKISLTKVRCAESNISKETKIRLTE